MSSSVLTDLPNWDLTHLYQSIDDPKIDEDFRNLEHQVNGLIGAYKDKLASVIGTEVNEEAAKGLHLLVIRMEEFYDLAGKLGSYGHLRSCTDLLDEKIGKAAGDIDQRLTDLSSKLSFLSLEINALDKDLVDGLCALDPVLGRYKPFFDDARLEKPYELSEPLERLFTDKSMTSASAWTRLFEETLSAIKVNVRGEDIAMEAALKHLSSKDASLREDAANALSAVFKSNIRLFTRIINTLVKDKEISDRWRGFKDVADSRHLANRVEREVVDALVSTVQDAYPRLSHRYYAMKAKWLGMEKLNHWDRNAPLPAQDDRVIPFDDAKATVLSSFEKFSPTVAGIAQRFFDEKWIDAPVKVGKATGAFAAPTVPSAHPYIMLNYVGETGDVMTMAHELGHGVHQVLAGKQGALMAGTPLTVAETASVFGEMLTFRSLLDATTDPEQRKALLADKVESMLNTVVRQIAFYTFERELHLRRREGELTPDDIAAIWLKVQRESLGDAILQNDGYETYWCYIGHFIWSPFYVYAYAFGDCLVNSLYARYVEQPEGFEEKYLALLEAGGSKGYRELLAPFNLDPSDPTFWRGGLKLIESFIDELETM